MDVMDWAILAELQADGRLSYSELSRRVHLSAPSVAERVRRLEENGVITGYHAHVDPLRAGRTVRAVIRMSCYGARCILRDERALALGEIVQVYRVTGDTCCLIMVAVPSMAAFEDLIDRLAHYGTPSSTMVLSSPVSWQPVTPLP
ncbi:Lrp/AsnC family transcriptional regulator [Spongiactinospora sp. TRM90649]|uniref:Lrp/AsnC family transcriptional regulator n=1 Tax=Spongiactinospora sp. TRM90649 TaxID=3031114 RepID=UPI0023F6A71B|nr:Lrp/AsnC family transcriptional regulator [Spongiactinospora sp. TRM90649]MDF5754231.1 Lrp/AsnC family transcriptional regulator [Spongiactinospora sp. TRM90649]